jgi:predicted GIY-YIG superfamily endonuclease
MINKRTAIYIIKQNDIPIYIGKSMDPYTRWLMTHNKFTKDSIMEIIDEYNDLEMEWIEKYKNKGILLENKITNKTTTYEWKVGDIYSH